MREELGDNASPMLPQMLAVELQITAQTSSSLLFRSPVRIGGQCEFLLATLFSRRVSIDVGFAMPVAKTHGAFDKSGLV